MPIRLKERIQEVLYKIVPHKSSLTTEEQEEASYYAIDDTLRRLVNSGNEAARTISALLEERKIVIVPFTSIKKSGFGEIPGSLLTLVDNHNKKVDLFLLVNTNLTHSLLRKSDQSFGAFLDRIAKSIRNLALQGFSPRIFEEKDWELTAQKIGWLVKKSGLEVKHEQLDEQVDTPSVL